MTKDKMFIPNKINHQFTQVVRSYAAAWVIPFELKREPRFYGVTQTRGRAYHNGGDWVITIPDWLLRYPDSEARIQEYIIHELAHIKEFELGRSSNHNQDFWDTFCKVCPPEWWEYEERYKPREFKRAGMHLLDVFAPNKRPKDLTEDDV